MDTFLVHVWIPADGAAPPSLRGVVRHVTSGVETPFRSDAEVLALLRRHPDKPDQPVIRITPEGD